ncbi:type IIB DNA topoisomerase domain-containing protein [Hirsutella rhossiliensis]|uniref:DNA topoisomerase (ATP-hydrolyzing) n=1 Tax=Hirsutella rhossiliensis TaxID=111463 RepID=A0A9P8N722_9HYPO|nr:type IIB DNA topoisomerase domain-containing protein [Hirsutella rhossiliensis]KAH0968020.1 type IIB DNA topoisomerase domain-containing protein [Hirsutella rhossiliensis]
MPPRREGLRSRGLGQSESSNAANGALIARMETLLESMVRHLSAGQEMSMELVSRRNLRTQDGDSRRQRVCFPGRTLFEGQKFARVLLVIQLSHDALVSGSILTKRQIFYQHQELFDKQRVVDELVDDLALTLGVHRHDLNIVASPKGLVSGPLTIRNHDGSAITASLGDTGTPIPVLRSIAGIECAAVKWILVVEKDATFRTLASSRYWETSAVGPGLLITAKGYPDLTTRSFLQLIHGQHAELPILVLTDFDPDGLNIFRCYRFGSDGAAHESAAQNRGLRWLGVKARHLQEFPLAPHASRASISSTSCRDPISQLTARDRKLATRTLLNLSTLCTDDPELERLQRELRRMLMMGIKAEIQWLDNAGNLGGWLDDNIGPMFSPISREQ